MSGPYLLLHMVGWTFVGWKATGLESLSSCCVFIFYFILLLFLQC